MRKFLGAAIVFVSVLVSGGCEEYTTTVEAPADLVGASWISSYIILDWEDVEDATTYNVYRSTTSGDLSSKTIVASSLPLSAYTDDDLASGTTYYYQVTAVNSDGESDGSVEINVALD